MTERAHLYVFSDACPSDWLEDGKDGQWHTIANFVFQAAPELLPLIDRGDSHEVVLEQDPLFSMFVDRCAPKGKWGRRAFGQRKKFCASLLAAQREVQPLVNGISFTGGDLRASKSALLSAYNDRIGGIEGRGIGFEEYEDSKGRKQMKHAFVNFHGYQEAHAPESQMLVLLLTAWFIADQYRFYAKVNNLYKDDGRSALGLTVVSDRLSGDDNLRKRAESALRRLIDPEGEEAPLTLARSSQSDLFPADLIVDNLAGWLNEAISDPEGAFADYAREMTKRGGLEGWRVLERSTDRLRSSPAAVRLAQ